MINMIPTFKEQKVNHKRCIGHRNDSSRYFTYLESMRLSLAKKIDDITMIRSIH